MPSEIYLDNNATTRPLEAVVAETVGYLREGFGNASSPHGRGVAARRALITARDRVARLLGARSDSVIFTAGATEANSLALTQVFADHRPLRLVTTTVEHSSVLETAAALAARGVEVVRLPVDSSGRVEEAALEAALGEPTGLVSIQWANSETGVVQDVETLGAICHDRGVPFHVDAAQAVGRLPIAFDDLPIDTLAFTGHKVHAPQGTGALMVREPKALVPLLHGGEQEHGMRAGTENLPGIMGLAKAAEIRHAQFAEAIATLQGLRDRFEARLRAAIPGLAVNGDPEHRVCNTTNIRFPNLDGQALMANLDREGIVCSQTSACTSSSPEPSYALTAMGLSRDEAFASVRFSFSVLNTPEEADAAADAIAAIHTRLAAFAAL